MSKNFAMVVFGLLVLYASQGWAGSMGNGAAQRRAAAGLPPEAAKTQTQYAFCYAGNPKVVYITQVITLPPAESAGNLGVTYRDFVKTKYGIPSIDRERCVTANSNADAAAEKQRYLGMFGRTKLIEIEWAGHSADAH